jgi:hypothetical protein
VMASTRVQLLLPTGHRFAALLSSGLLLPR